MCQPGGTFSWLYMPIINAALNRQGGVCLDYDGFDRPQGFQNIVNGYRHLFQQYDVTPANTLNANGSPSIRARKKSWPSTTTVDPEWMHMASGLLMLFRRPTPHYADQDLRAGIRRCLTSSLFFRAGTRKYLTFVTVLSVGCQACVG